MNTFSKIIALAAAAALCWGTLGAQTKPGRTKREKDKTTQGPTKTGGDNNKLGLPNRGKSTIESILDEVPVNASATKVRQVITFAARDAGWTTSKGEEGDIEARFNFKDKYEVLVGIAYTQKDYEIYYIRSVGMGYNEATKTLNSRYYDWVKALNTKIQNAFLLVDAID